MSFQINNDEKSLKEHVEMLCVLWNGRKIKQVIYEQSSVKKMFVILEKRQ